MVLVSVLIPSYNHGIYLTETIESVLNQTSKDLELIIIDDCSTDNSKAIIKNYEKKDKRIRALYHEYNRGAVTTMNELIELAKGKYIAFLNSDDAWEKTKLKTQLKVLENNENLIVWTEGDIIDKNSKSIGKTFTQWHGAEKKKKSGNIFEELLMLENFLCFSSVLFKKALLGEIRFNPNFEVMADFAFEVDLAKHYEFFYINKPLTKYRIHDKNTSLNYTGMTIDLINHKKYFLNAYGKEIPIKTKLYLYNSIIKLSIRLSVNLKSLPRGFEVDIHKYIFSLKNEPKYVINELLKNQNSRIFWAFYELYRNSFNSFIVGLALLFKFKKIKRSIRFWVNFIIFLFIKLIPKVNFSIFFLRK